MDVRTSYERHGANTMSEPSALLLARRQRGWSQEQAIVRLESVARTMAVDLPTRTSLRTLLSLFENQHRAVPQYYHAIFRELYRSTDQELGFTLCSAEAFLPASSSYPVPGVDRVTPELMDYLSSVLLDHVRADTMIGPRLLIPTVESMAPLVHRLCEGARNFERRQVLSIAARFAQVCGWLQQDAGNTDAAICWTNRALDYAHELGNQDTLSYTLMRKSNIASDAGQPGHALGLANASLNSAEHSPPLIHAVSLRQHARAHAMLSERTSFERSIDAALTKAYAGDEDAGDDLATGAAKYCTPSYVAMEAGISWVELGQPERGVCTLEEALASWPATSQARDRGLCLARLATRAAACGDSERALNTASEALVVARTTGSARIRTQLSAAYHHLARLGSNESLTDLKHQLQMLSAS